MTTSDTASTTDVSSKNSQPMHPLEFAFKYRRDVVPTVQEWQRMYDSFMGMYQDMNRSKDAVSDALRQAEDACRSATSKDASDGYMIKFENLVHQIRNLITVLENDYRIEKHTDVKSQLRIIRASFNTLQGEWWRHVQTKRFEEKGFEAKRSSIKDSASDRGARKVH